MVNFASDSCVCWYIRLSLERKAEVNVLGKKLGINDYVWMMFLFAVAALSSTVIKLIPDSSLLSKLANIFLLDILLIVVGIFLRIIYRTDYLVLIPLIAALGIVYVIAWNLVLSDLQLGIMVIVVQYISIILLRQGIFFKWKRSPRR